MNFFWVLSGNRIKRVAIIAIAIVFAAGITYAEKKNVSVFSPDESGPSAIYNVKTDKKVVALTFDISWGEKRTIPILNTLKQKGVKKSTFFLSSPWAEAHPDIVKKITDMKYEIGSHGHKHQNYSTLDETQIQKQIRTSDNILKKVTGEKPKLIRFPNGDFDKRVLKMADKLGYTTIQWDTDSRDWMNPGVDQIVNRVVTKAHPGDIILMHASDSCKQTHLALPKIIDQLRAKGYKFVTVSELLAGSDVKNQSVE